LSAAADQPFVEAVYLDLQVCAIDVLPTTYGMIATKVKGTTKPMSTAPTSQSVPPPRSYAAAPESRLTIAKEACITVARA